MSASTYAVCQPGSVAGYLLQWALLAFRTCSVEFGPERGQSELQPSVSATSFLQNTCAFVFVCGGTQSDTMNVNFWKERDFRVHSVSLKLPGWSSEVVFWLSGFDCLSVHIVNPTAFSHETQSVLNKCDHHGNVTQQPHGVWFFFSFFLVLRLCSYSSPPQVWRRRVEENLHFFPSSPLMHSSFHTFPQTP